jgi:hypothetical protein
MFTSKHHLLHGVLHLNGYGHLCRVNGREGGSAQYTGTQLMDVWDDLCAVLRARCVSVEDVSNKLTMELRVLSPLAEGRTWYAFRSVAACIGNVWCEAVMCNMETFSKVLVPVSERRTWYASHTEDIDSLSQ